MRHCSVNSSSSLPSACRFRAGFCSNASPQLEGDPNVDTANACGLTTRFSYRGALGLMGGQSCMLTVHHTSCTRAVSLSAASVLYAIKVRAQVARSIIDNN